MPPAPRDTPPASPDIRSAEVVEDNYDADLDAGDIIEVIDLDEVEGQDDDDEEGMDDFGGAGALGTPERVPEDNSDLIFSKHGKSVFCCDLIEKAGRMLAVSGGEDDKVFLWDAATGEVLMESKSHFKDSVVYAEFSHDGTYVAVADLSGVIKVWKLNGDLSANKEVVWEFETSDILCMFWHHGANVLFAGTVDSELWMWKIPSGESKVFLGHGEKVEIAKLFPDGKKALACYTDGTMRLFDLKSGSVIHNFTGNSGHEGAITSVDIRQDGVVIVTGATDGMAKISSNAGKNLASLPCASAPITNEDGEEESDPKSAVEAVLFSASEGNQLITGTLEGTVTVWDISTHVSRHSERFGCGVVKMEARKNSTSEIFVATLDGLVRLYDFRLGKIIADCSGHTAAVLDFAQSSDGNLIVTSSDDGLCRVFDIRKVTSSS